MYNGSGAMSRKAFGGGTEMQQRTTKPDKGGAPMKTRSSSWLTANLNGRKPLLGKRRPKPLLGGPDGSKVYTYQP